MLEETFRRLAAAGGDTLYVTESGDGGEVDYRFRIAGCMRVAGTLDAASASAFIDQAAALPRVGRDEERELAAALMSAFLGQDVDDRWTVRGRVLGLEEAWRVRFATVRSGGTRWLSATILRWVPGPEDRWRASVPAAGQA